MNAVDAPIPAVVSLDDSTHTRLRRRWLWVARAIWGLVVVLVIVMFGLGIPLRVGDMRVPCIPEQCRNLHLSTEGAQALEAALGLTPLTFGILVAAMESYLTLVFFVGGVIIAWRRSDDWMALFSSAVLILAGVGQTAFLSTLALQMPFFSIPVRLIGSLARPLIILLFYLFPDGRITPGWMRWPAFIITGLTVFMAFNYGLFTPSGLPFLAMAFAGGVFSQIYRYRNVSSPAERQQTKWVIFGFTVMFLGIAITAVTFLVWPVKFGPNGFVIRTLPDFILAVPFAFVFVFLPLSIVPITFAISTLRFGLWNVDPILNRTLVYGSLTALVVGIYVVIVGSLGIVLQTGANLPVSLFATGIVAVLFQPLRQRLQRGVNRLMYGERDEPYAVLGRLAERLEVVVASQSVLPTIVETVAQAFKLPYAAIALKEGENFKTAAEYTRASTSQPKPNSAMEILPLVYQLETIGQLLLAPRAPGEHFSQTDHRLLETIARQAGIAAYNVRLTQDLQRSRERLVTTREEERRRLRRDLHDSLGPALASMSFKLDAVHNMADRDPTRVKRMATELKTQMEEALTDIRRIAYNLRPPALDELGLVGALKEHITACNKSGNLQVALDAPQNIPQLRAAVEVAAYRIAMEAMTNVSRHANAGRCQVRLSLDDCLCLEIEDDGQGMSGNMRAGVGMSSMRERAEELGGTCAVAAIPTGGMCVTARLPLPAMRAMQDEGC